MPTTKVVRNLKKVDRGTKQRESGQQRPAAADRGLVRQASHSASTLPMLRTSERTAAKRCYRKWDLEFNLDLKPRDTSAPLFLGSMVHQALAAYYIKGKKRGPSPVDTFISDMNDWDATTGQTNEAFDSEAQYELGVAMLENYLDHYGADDEWEVLATEFPFQHVVNRPPPREVEPWFWYVGVLDLLIRHLPTKRILLVDHKTAAAIQTKYLALDDQSTAYWTFGPDSLKAARAIPPGMKIDGMIFNILRKQKPDERPFIFETDDRGQLRKYHTNKDGSVSAKQPAPYFHRETIYRDAPERESARGRVELEYLRLEELRKDKSLIYPTFGQWTCPGCPWFQYCEMKEAGHDADEFLGLTTQTWEPYEAHQIYIGDTK